MKHRGFTIVELLVVVAILGVLIGIISVAVTGSLKNARSRRTETMRVVLEQALNAYYAQKGEWPAAIENEVDSSGDDSDTIIFSPDKTDTIFRGLVENSVGNNATRPLLDPTGLFVANANSIGNNKYGCYDNHSDKTDVNALGESTYCGGKGCVSGCDFSLAVKQTVNGKKNGKHLAISQMAFGYQGHEHGKFRRFWIKYNRRTDSVRVLSERE